MLETVTLNTLGQKTTALSFKRGETISVALTVTALTGRVVLEKSKFLDVGWTEVSALTGAGTITHVVEDDPQAYFRVRLAELAEGDECEAAISEAAQVLQSFKNDQGVEVLRVTDAGIVVPGTLVVEGSSSLKAVAVTGNTTFGANGAGVDVVMYGATAGKETMWDASDNKLIVDGAAQATGALAVGGDFAVATNKFTVAAASGNTAAAGTLGVTGLATATAGVASVAGAGAPPVLAGLTAVELGDGVFHKTVLTLAAVEFGLLDDAGVGQYGGVKLYDFPAGNITILGATIDADITLVGDEWLDTAEGDVAIGTVVASSGDALATTEQNIIPTTAIAALVAQVGPINANSSAVAVLPAAGTDDNDAILNVRIDDNVAHIAATATVTGTVTLCWANYGDY